MTTTRHRGFPFVRAMLRIVVPLGLMTLVVAMNRPQLREVLGRRPEGRLFALGFAAYLLGVAIAHLRWFILVRALDLPFRPRDALRLGFIGTLFNLVIPGAIGGDFVKAAYLARSQTRKTAAVATVLIDRFVGLLGLFLLAALVGSVHWGTLEPRVRRLVVAAWTATAIIGLILTIAFTPALYRPLARLASHRQRLGRLLNELVATGSAYRGRLGAVGLGIVMATCTHVFNVLGFYAVDRAISPHAPGLAAHFLIVPLVLFSTGVPLPLNALGFTEAISAGLFRLARHDGGAIAMIAFRVLQFGGAMIGGCVYLANARQVRALRREAETLVDEAFDPDLTREPSAVLDR